MPKKEKEVDPYKAKNLVIFKEEEESQSKTVDKYTFEKVDQEYKIRCKCDFSPFGSHFRYSIFIENQSLAPVTEMKIKIRFPEFLTLIRAFPPKISIPQMITDEQTNQINFDFDELNEKSNKQIHLHFSPNSLDKTGDIRTIVTYVNNKDTVRVIDSRPANITVDKIALEPKVVPSSFIREFSLQPGIKKVIKSMGIGIEHQVHSEIIYDILEQLFSIYNFQLVAKDVEKRILWYFGTESVIKEDILAIGQILSNKIEIIASSLNHYLLISFLTQISNDFKQFLILNGIINSEDKVHDLECKNCGVILAYFPQKSQTIECQNCNYEQTIW
ncbi:MAG: hypothetical protein HWN81_18165 [Candidatus Lokiarchaeota archaeon]|nr:hypothetical protein [Candidatus Lokiarchaeota archaeon]